MAAPRIALVDNGSLRAAATRSLREVAARLAERTGRAIEPVSLLHSSAVPAEQLDGAGAELLEPWLKRHAAEGERDFVVLPLFFGPSRALTLYIPERVAHLRTATPDLRVRLAPPLVRDDGDGIAEIAAALVERVRGCDRGDRPAVAVVDHGSPEPRVAAVRDAVAAEVARLLAGDVRAVAPCSMERREGPEFAFSDPLLGALLQRAPFAGGDVVVAMMFLSPGRHAGPDGDVARICCEAEARVPGLRTRMTELLGGHPRIGEILARRLDDAAGVSPL